MTKILSPEVRRIKQERLLELLTEQKKRRSLEDLWYFNRYVLDYKDLTEPDGFHGELCDFISDTEKENVLILEPRGSLKTSCSLGYILQSMVKDPNVRILLCSEEFLTSKKFLAEIKGHIEKNPKFIKLFGELKGDSKWSESEIIISTRTKWRKEPTITCAGIDVTKVGLHYDIVVIDDPHSSKNVTTREQIEKVKVWYRLVRSLLDPGGKLIVIATRWHYDDLSGYLIETERQRDELGLPKRFHILVKDAFKGEIKDLRAGTIPREDFLWPDRLSPEFLLDQLLDQGPYIFSCQYRNNPVDDESAVFKKSWLRFYDPENLPKALEVFTTIDPMRDETGADFCAMVTCGYDAAWNQYVLDIRRAKMDEYEVIDQMFSIYKAYNPRKMGIETVAWQKSYYRFLKNEMVRRGLKLPLVELTTDTKTTKRLRIRSMVPYFRMGLIKLPGSSVELLKGNMAVLADELLRFPLVSNDDVIDALAYQDQLSKRPTVAKIIKLVPPGSFLGAKNSIPKQNHRQLGVYNVR